MSGPGEAAIGWALRVADPAFDEWDAFTAWLEAAPDHAARYDAAVLLIEDATRLLAPPPAPVMRVPAPRRRAVRWIAPALAACLTLAVGIGAWRDRAQPYAVATAPGAIRTLALADGSRVTLGGASRVVLDRAHPRIATVERGEALFDVRHDARNPFRVRAGGLELTDLGTVFDVRRDADTTRVAVAQGMVLVDPDGAALRLRPGEAARVTGDAIERSSIDPADVGAWRTGRLAFSGAALDEVARELSRYLAVRVIAAPTVAARRFNGTLDVRALRDRPALLGELLGVDVRRDANGWTLGAAR